MVVAVGPVIETSAAVGSPGSSPNQRARVYEAVQRARLRRVGVSDELLQALERSQRQLRHEQHRQAWVPWPQCTGTTTQGEHCRRGAICDRATRRPYEGARCRWHIDPQVLPEQLRVAADRYRRAIALVEHRFDSKKGAND
jgi:hypothetical protein